MEGEEESKIGKYRVPKPDQSGEFIYAECPGKLFQEFKDEWYKPALDSPSIRGKIQYIVENFK